MLKFENVHAYTYDSALLQRKFSLAVAIEVIIKIYYLLLTSMAVAQQAGFSLACYWVGVYLIEL